MTKKLYKSKNLKRKTIKNLSLSKNTVSWCNITNYDNAKINKLHRERKNIINNIFYNFLCSIQKYNIEIKLEKDQNFYNCDKNVLDLFISQPASNNSLITVYKLQPFLITADGKTILSVSLAGTGIKSNSDIDIDIVLTSSNNSYIQKLQKTCVKLLSNLILDKMNKIAFSYQYDTNFYFSKYWIPIQSNLFNIYYIAIIAKLQLRFKLDFTSNQDLYKDNLNLSRVNMKEIVDFYSVNSNKLYRNIEKIFFKNYIKLIEKYLNHENTASNKEKTEILCRFLLYQPESYVYPLTTALATDNSKKINIFLKKIKNNEKLVNLAYYLAALENLIDCLYQQKPKYLLRSLKSLQNIVIKNKYLMDSNLVDKINHYLECLKTNNKIKINYNIEKPIILDLNEPGNCDKEACQFIKKKFSKINKNCATVSWNKLPNKFINSNTNKIFQYQTVKNIIETLLSKLPLEYSNLNNILLRLII